MRRLLRAGRLNWEIVEETVTATREYSSFIHIKIPVYGTQVKDIYRLFTTCFFSTSDLAAKTSGPGYRNRTKQFRFQLRLHMYKDSHF